MSQGRCILCSLFFAVILNFSGCASPALHLARTIPLPGVEGDDDTASVPGRFDHFAYDAATHRLFVAAVAHGSLQVIDLDRGERVKSITGLGHPQGVAIATNTGQAIVACGTESAIRAYDTRTLEEKGKCELGEDTDNVRCANGYIFVGYGSETAGAIATVDPRTLTKISEMPLKAHPESFQLASDGHRVYVNIPWAKRADVDGSVVAGDLKAGAVTSRWTLAQTSRNFPMALDEKNHRLFVASRKPAKLMCLNTDNGNVLSEVACADESDDIYRDEKTGDIIVIGGGKDGVIELFAVGAKGKMKPAGVVATAPNARTGYFDFARRAVYVAVPKYGGHDAEVREYILNQ